MERIEFDDGKWFDAEKADAWEIGPNQDMDLWNVNTECWDVQFASTLYRTRSGTYVVNDTENGRHYSIADELAARLFIKYNHLGDPPEDLESEIERLED